MKSENNIPQIYWIGGSTCAGKTSIANILAEKYRFSVYHCDEYLGKHIERSNAQQHPNLNKVTKINWNDILSMSVEEYLNWSVGLFTEEFDMILEDLHKLSDDKPIVVEGVGLFPELICNKISDTCHAVWVVADEAFYKKHQMQRKELFDRVNGCSNPEQALQNYTSYDLAMGKYILNNAKRRGLNVVEVSNESDLAKSIEIVTSYLDLSA